MLRGLAAQAGVELHRRGLVAEAVGLVAQAGASCSDLGGGGGVSCTDKRNIVLLIPRRNVIIYIVETNGIKI